MTTGDAAVDAIMARAAQAATLPTSEHVGLYTSLIEELRGELDADPAAGQDPAQPGGGA